MQVFFCEHFLYFHNKRISLCFQSCLQEFPVCLENSFVTVFHISKLVNLFI